MLDQEHRSHAAGSKLAHDRVAGDLGDLHVVSVAGESAAAVDRLCQDQVFGAVVDGAQAPAGGGQTRIRLPPCGIRLGATCHVSGDVPDTLHHRHVVGHALVEPDVDGATIEAMIRRSGPPQCSTFKTQQQISPNDGVVGPKTMGTLDAIFVDEVPFPQPVPGHGEMTVDDFIEAMEASESANSTDTVEEFITRVRQLYYPGIDPDDLTFREVAFDRLLPDSPRTNPDGSRRILTPAGMDPIFFGRLATRAPENPNPGKPFDNPSPYFFDATAQRVDLGHLLLTLDALLHPRSETPYSEFEVPAIDPASWPADLGIAAVWAEQNGLPDAPRVLPPLAGGPDFPGYYTISAPEADLYGDIDGFNIAAFMLAGESLSSTLARYYLDGETAPGGYRQRFRTFANTLWGSTSPDEADLQTSVDQWTLRVDRFNDLYALGSAGAFLSLTPTLRRQWQFTPEALATFFQWVIDQLAIEADRFD